MEISGTNIGATTFAMKKAMEMPKTLISLVQNSAVDGGQTLGTKAPDPQMPNLSAVTGKGRIIDLVA